MSLEHAFFLSQIIAAMAVVASLIFVGSEIRGNTQAVQRAEHNSTMEQWTVIRMAMAKDREIAELVATGLGGGRDLDAADQLRLEQVLAEIAAVDRQLAQGKQPPAIFGAAGLPDGAAPGQAARAST